MQQLMKRNVQVGRRHSLTGLRFRAVVHIHVEVGYGLPWKEAVKLGAPGTSNNSQVMRLGDQYHNGKTGKDTITLSLCYTGPPAGYNGWMIEDAVKFVEVGQLPIVGPRELLAIGQHHPSLREELLASQDPVIHREFGHALNFCLAELDLLILSPCKIRRVEHMLNLKFKEGEPPLMDEIASDRRVNCYTCTWMVLGGEVPLAP